MTKRTRAVDAKCLELAEHFLRDVAAAHGAEQQKLAEAIQEVCEDFCSDVEAGETLSGDAALTRGGKP